MRDSLYQIHDSECITRLDEPIDNLTQVKKAAYLMLLTEH